MAGLVPAIHVFLSSCGKAWMPGTSPGMTLCHWLNPLRVERRLLPGPVLPQRPVLADRVGPLEDPVLPRGQPREDLRLHGLRPGEAQVRLHAGERVGREA